MKNTILILILTLAPLPVGAQPWIKPYSKWSTADARKVLNSSPWVKRQRIDTGGEQRAITVRWEGAAIVQEALRQTKQGTTNTSGCVCYKIAVFGLPDQLGDPLVYLRLDGTDPVPPLRSALVEQAGDRPYWVFSFRRNEIEKPGVFRLPFPFTGHRKSFDFHLRYGTVTVQKAFVIADMLYLGELDL